jgi:hypothetical protein
VQFFWRFKPLAASVCELIKLAFRKLDTNKVYTLS